MLNIVSRKFNIGLLTILVFITLLISAKSAIAGRFEDLNLPDQKVNPDNFIYPAKRLWEKIRVKLIFNEKVEINYYETLIEKRMSELGYVAKNKKIGELQKASERLTYFSGVSAEKLEQISGMQQEKKDLKEMFELYEEPLGELRDIYPANSSQWLLIQYSIDSLDIYKEKL